MKCRSCGIKISPKLAEEQAEGREEYKELCRGCFGWKRAKEVYVK